MQFISFIGKIVHFQVIQVVFYIVHYLFWETHLNSPVVNASL